MQCFVHMGMLNENDKVETNNSCNCFVLRHVASECGPVDPRGCGMSQGPEKQLSELFRIMLFHLFLF